MAKRRWPKRHDIIDSHRQVVERVRKADIARAPETAAPAVPIGGGSVGATVILERQAASDESEFPTISWNTIIEDNSGGALWVYTSPTHLVAPVAGVYEVKTRLVTYDESASGGAWQLVATKNSDTAGGQQVMHYTQTADPFMGITSVLDIPLAAGDYIEIFHAFTGKYTQTDYAYGPHSNPRVSFTQIG